MGKTHRDKKRYNTKEKQKEKYDCDIFYDLHRPPKKYKRFTKKSRRSKEKQALKNNINNEVPLFKKSDTGDYWGDHL